MVSLRQQEECTLYRCDVLHHVRKVLKESNCKTNIIQADITTNIYQYKQHLYYTVAYLVTSTTHNSALWGQR